ncbi:LA_2272 family surface repeat-containing protein [Spirochaeta cellobiosiphila]|uniref:LA_2272 family surface repeat-containing protein n=1 Tax=Spirochaeta cellobiosiphila TaxID=504483 RepID=UPI00041829D4|nr:hypothetical protein [Spirochaeta cellobiosiphila]
MMKKNILFAMALSFIFMSPLWAQENTTDTQEDPDFDIFYWEWLSTPMLGPSDQDALMGMGLLFSNVNRLYSFQAAPLSATTSGRAIGWQLSGILSHARNDFYGVQLSGIITNVQQDMFGLQVSGAVAYVDGNFKGIQHSGFLSIVHGNVSGIQSTGLINIIMGQQTKGLQLSGIINSAHDFSGAQFGGYNRADKLKGLQFGFVNKATETNGMQIGLVNFNKHQKGFNLGLINISEDGIFHPTYWMDQNQYSYIGFQQGTKHFYTIAYAGMPNEDLFEQTDYAILGVGLGIREQYKQIFLETDLSAQTIAIKQIPFESDNYHLSEHNVYPSYRIQGGFYLTKRIALYGGANWIASIDDVTFESEIFEGDFEQLSWKGTDFKLYPRYYFGIKL